MRSKSVAVVIAAAAFALAVSAAPTLGGAAVAGSSVRITASGDFAATSSTAAVLDGIAAAAPDLHLALGDLSYGASGAEQAWCDFVTSRVGAGFAFELLAGNHESNGQNGDINDFSVCLPNQLPGLVGTYGRQWYVDVPRDEPVVRVVMISPALSFPDGMWNYQAGSARYAWTASAIDSARAAGVPWVIVGMHKPCLSMGQYPCDPGADLMNLLVSRRVDLVLSGHEHFYQRTKQLAHGPGCTAITPGVYAAACVADADRALARGAGTVFVTIGTGGVELREVNFSDSEAAYHAAWSGLNANPTWGSLTVMADGQQLSASFTRAAGGTFADNFTISQAAGSQSPVASIAAPSCANLSCSFDGSGSSDSDGAITSYAWDFGDGTTASGATRSHVYAAAGTRTVTLTVTDDDNETDVDSCSVTVSAPPVGDLAIDTGAFSLRTRFRHLQCGAGQRLPQAAGDDRFRAGSADRQRHRCPAAARVLATRADPRAGRVGKALDANPTAPRAASGPCFCEFVDRLPGNTVGRLIHFELRALGSPGSATATPPSRPDRR